MSIEVVGFKIVGLKPLMQSCGDNKTFDEGEDDIKLRKKSVRKPHEEAKNLLYRNDDGFYHPAQAFHTQLMQDTTGRQVRGIAATTQCATAVAIADEHMLLYDPDTFDSKKPKKLTDKDWVVDSRMAWNKKVGFVPVHRPKWRKWGGLLYLEVDMEMWTAAKETKAEALASAKTLLAQLLCLVGSKFGIGCGRIRKDGTKWGGLGMGKYRAEAL